MSKKPKTPKIPHCLQLDLPNLNFDKATAAVEYLKDLFSSYGALGCMRSKCTTCINYCKHGVFLKSHGFRYMISHKMSLITIFGHKHFTQKFHKKFDIFHKKIQQPLVLVHILK